MPKSESLKTPPHPALGITVYQQDEAVAFDLASLPVQMKALLDSHAAALEATLSKVVLDSERRLREQASADIRAVLGVVEPLRPEEIEAVELAQCFPRAAARDDEQGAELKPDPARAGGAGSEELKSAWRGGTQGSPFDAHSRSFDDPPITSRSSPSLRQGSGSVLAEVSVDGRRKSRRLSRASSTTSTAEDVKALRSMKRQSEVMMDSVTRYNSETRSRRRETPVEKAALIVEALSTFVLVANVIWMAAATEISMHYVKKGEASPGYIFWIDLSFVIAMCVEVGAKLILFRMDFFVGPGHRWNAFDVILIILAAVDLLLSAANLSFIRVLRGLRAVRATRVIRTAAVVPELRLMFASVIASVASLFWAFVLILLVLFLCALGVQQTVHSTLETSGVASQHPQLLEFYGTLPTTMLSLFMAISGGADWKDLAEPLVHISRVYILAYILFIILMIFGLLNILTAVFVDKTSNIAHIDPELVIHEKLAEETSAIKQLRHILGETDTDATGTITKDALTDRLSDPLFRAQMQLLDLNILEVQGVFQILDADRRGAIEIEQLVYGLMRMKGSASSMDMHTMVYDTKRLLARLAAFQQNAEASLKDLHASLTARSGARTI